MNKASNRNDNTRAKKIYAITLWGSLGNALLLILKFVAGILGHSAAMIADAVHSLSDFATDLVVLIFVKISNKPSDEKHGYGHGKFETLATAIIALTLTMVGIALFYSSANRIIRFWNGEISLSKPGLIALIVAGISVISKELLFRTTRKVGEDVKSKAVIANAWHHRSDAYSSIATLIGIGGAFLLGKGWLVLEPMAAAGVSIFIVKVGLELAAPAFRDLLEQRLSPEIEKEIQSIIQSNPGVKQLGHMRTRSIGNDYAIEADILVDGSISVEQGHKITVELEQKLRKTFGRGTHIVIHVEPLKQNQ